MYQGAGDFGQTIPTVFQGGQPNNRFKPYHRKEREFHHSPEGVYPPPDYTYDMMSYGTPPDYAPPYPHGGYFMPPPHQFMPPHVMSMEKVYTSLCVSNIKRDQTDAEVAAMLRSALGDYPDCSIQFSTYMKDRVVYLNFTNSDRAQQLYSAIKGKYVCVPDKMLYIEPVFASRRNQQYHGAMEQQSSKYKFPHHLDHKRPEDDYTATRTLFVGNLDPKITRNELIFIFGQFGDVIDLDWKPPVRREANAYAFVMFKNVGIAYEAKVALSGKKLGRYYCKIGYGKISPTNCVWVGNISPDVATKQLEAEFDRFGSTTRFVYDTTKDYAFFLYESLDAATAAVGAMRGHQFPNMEERLQVDYIKLDEIDNHEFCSINSQGEDPQIDGLSNIISTAQAAGAEEDKKRQRREHHKTAELAQTADSTEQQIAKISLTELSLQRPQTWSGFFIVKNTAFSVRLVLLSGEPSFVTDLLTETSVRVTQRMKLETRSCEEVGSKCQAALLALPCPVSEPPEGLQLRQPRQLISYFKQKDAGGIAQMGAAQLYMLPQCDFVDRFLRSRVGGLTTPSTEDFLLVFLHGGKFP